MLNHRQIVDAWLVADNFLQEKQNRARVQSSIDKLTQQRFINDCAYFLMLFANFEAFLTTKAVSLITHKQAGAAWSSRRGWDVLKAADADRINFRHRLSYCLDKTTPSWSLISGYYKIRNDLAHTGVTATAFAIPVVASDLKQVGASLKDR